ncbi:hypothetical protein SAMN05660420_01428 [Desulfuromusa kysingii]|uniref:Uncharacterized protein n=1 Tax=Desulfuromusa kysingii TaxID=37625 RepID=A0A1H3YX94_9BACT|nr:hypothetical protein [Desulfuromusa kysingii]SEA16086.1 hypothetical protein SAMN05660420_01428 [Desulfuromusa kysingii]
MRKKNEQTVEVFSDALNEWLMALKQGGKFRISIPPKKLNRMEMGILQERMKECEVDYDDAAALKLCEVIQEINSKK